MSNLHAPTIRLVVFDWSGTTVDFGGFGPVESFTRTLERQGLAPTAEQVRGPMGVSSKDHLRALLQIPELDEQWQAQHDGPWDESDIDRIYREDYVPIQLETIVEHDRLVPGLLPVLQDLKARGIRLATTTGDPREAANLLFASARRQGFVRDLDVVPDMVSEGRPAPWMIYHAMKWLGIYPPSGVVKVGDTLADIAEGRNAGAWSVGVISGSSEVGLSEDDWKALREVERQAISRSVGSRFIKAGAHAIIETLGELPGVIDALESGSMESTP